MADKFQNNKQIYDKNQDMIEDQDKHLDEIIDGLEKTKYVTGEINQEVKRQDPLLKNLKGDFNSIDSKMKRANEKISRLIHNQSYWRLYCIILAEVVILVLLILM